MSVAIQNYRNRIHPKKFALWIACASMGMLFAAFSSAYVVRHAAGNWLEFRLPDIFWYSTGIIILSSITLQASYHFFTKENTFLYRSLLLITFLLGLGFLVSQYQGWQAMKAIGVELTTNPSGSFVYVISAMHAAHLLGGLGALLVAVIHALMLPHRVTPARKLRFELTYNFWHFLGILWIYLILFFTNQ